ncbi:MAG TPA: hypothetical protein VFD92_23000 [Candidatus Binatia bacterium]|nr:hypothetical protein [Candidatus Binatia bacterium]
MTISRKALCAPYGLIGAVALLGTWGNVLGAVAQDGFWAGTVHSARAARARAERDRRPAAAVYGTRTPEP